MKLLGSWRREVALLVVISVLGALIYFLPFWLGLDSVAGVKLEGKGVEVVQRHWDGPLYAVVARTFYQPDDIYSWWSLPRQYYSAHLPGYPATIRLFSYIAGYLNGMLVASLVWSTLAALALYLFLYRFGQEKGNAFWVALAFLFLPPRWLLYRYSGASEPLFLLEVILSVYFFRRKNYFLCGLAGAAAMVTRVQGLALLPAYAAILLFPRRDAQRKISIPWRHVSSLLPLSTMVLAFALLYLLYHFSYGDGLINYHGGFYTKIKWPPFVTVSLYGIWSEGSLYAYALALLGSFWLAWRREWDLSVVSLAFALPTFFMAQHDITRYILPAVPFSLFFAGERIIASRPFRLMLLVMLPGLFIYVWSALVANMAPEVNFHLLQKLLPSSP